MNQPIPEFESEYEERMFWDSHDSSKYLDWRKAQRVSFPMPFKSIHEERKVRFVAKDKKSNNQAVN